MDQDWVSTASFVAVVATWAGGLWGMFRYGRRFRAEVGRFACQLGLTFDGNAVTGELDGLPVRMFVRSLKTKFHDGDDARTMVTTVCLPLSPQHRFTIVDRRERLEKPPPPLSRTTRTGHAPFDRIYLIHQDGEPLEPGWSGAPILKNLLDCRLLQAVGMDGKLCLDFHHNSSSPARMKRALLTTLAMTSSDRLAEWLGELQAPLGHGISFPAGLTALVLSLIGGGVLESAGVTSLGGSTDWKVHYAAVYAPVLGLVFALQILWRRCRTP